MFPLSLPFHANQLVTVPAGTKFMCNGEQSYTQENLIVTVMRVLHGHVECVAGSLISHPPILLAKKGQKAASYEISLAMLEANNVAITVPTLLEQTQQVPVA